MILALLLVIGWMGLWMCATWEGDTFGRSPSVRWLVSNVEYSHTKAIMLAIIFIVLPAIALAYVGFMLSNLF